MNTLKYKSALCKDLESQLAKVIEKNTQLTMANSDLQKKVVELQDVSEECATLKETLEKVETDCQHAKSEVSNLNGKVCSIYQIYDYDTIDTLCFKTHVTIVLFPYMFSAQLKIFYQSLLSFFKCKRTLAEKSCEIARHLCFLLN